MVIEDMKAQICISKYFWPLIFLVIIILIIYTTRLFFLASDFCTTSAGNGGKKLHYKMTNITKRYNDDGGKNQFLLSCNNLRVAKRMKSWEISIGQDLFPLSQLLCYYRGFI
ncbi:uncharacterized protein [Euphorbia lathyris]|uniref:uncharacterized protein isoform X2 n=1 Tax=Euphorbia lathyris TaxID=212925 RepID=UPI0033139C11